MWHPDAIRRPIPPGANDPPIIPIGMIFHVRAGEGPSLYPYFNGPSGGIESHAYTRYDGTLEQYRDSHVEADANYKANSFVRDGKRYGFFSVETEGLEFGTWTGAQMRRNLDLIDWGHEELGIPLQVCSGPFAPGFGFHTMFDEWVPGGKDQKTCPGPRRKEQFYDDMVPYINTGGTDMVTAAQLWGYKNPNVEPNNDDDAYAVLLQTRAQSLYLEQQLKSVGSSLVVIAKGLRDGSISDAEYQQVVAAVSGQNREVPPIHYKPRPQ